jgi:hypothetical protein
MKEYIVLIYYAIVCIASIVFMYFALDAADKKIDCSIAEISPDYSPADRQRCREYRIKQASQKHSL